MVDDTHSGATSPTGGGSGSADRVLRHRHALIAFAAISSSVLAGGRGDWNYFVEVGRSLFTGAHFDVYVAYPDAQTGPLALALAAVASLTPRDGFVLAELICLAAGLVLVRRIEQTQSSSPRRQLATLVGGVAVMVWWSQLAKFGHVDDALTLTVVTFAVLRHREGHTARSAVLVGVATLLKPWAVIFAPLGLDVRGSRTDRARSTARNGLLMFATAAVGWLPFIIIAPDTISSIKPTVGLAPDSVLRWLGLAEVAGSQQLRLAQLGVSAAVVAATVVLGRVESALAAGVATRLILDPGTWSYYTSGLVLGAFLADSLRRQTRLPWRTLFAATLVDPPFALLSHDPSRAALRFASSLGLIGACFMTGRGGSISSGAEPENASGPRHSAGPTSVRSTEDQ